MQSVFAKKMQMYIKIKKERRHCKNNLVSSKHETLVLRMIYKSTLKCPNDSSRLWWNREFCEKINKLSHPISSMALGRHTTTTAMRCRSAVKFPPVPGMIPPVPSEYYFSCRSYLAHSCSACGRIRKDP